MILHIDPTLASAISVASKRVGTSWAWYVIRGAGFTAAGLIFLLMLSGIGQATGITYRYIEPIKAWAIHKAMALALIGAITIHIGFLLIDHYVHFSLVSLFIPFISKYSNDTKFLNWGLGGLAVTFGILAMYGVVIIVVSSLNWIDTKKSTWKQLHYLSYAVVILVFLHALYSGTDLKYGIFRLAWILGGLVILLAIVARVLRAGTMRPK
jgi:DMSO/TMAO reductase YedYZ heme-binding membrane subunit